MTTRIGRALQLMAVLLAVGCGGAEPDVEEVPAGAEVNAPAPPEAAGPAGDTVRGTSEPATGTPPGPAAPPSASTAPSAAPPATEPAGTTVPAGDQDAGARVLRGAAAAYEQIRALQADFTMTVENPLLRSTTTSRGTLFQRRPDRILLRFSEPAGDVIVGDGTYFWVYYPSTDPQQVLRAPASQAGAGGVDLQAQFVGDPVARFNYTLHGQEDVNGRPAHVVTMRPRVDAGYESLKVWVDARDSVVRRFEITEHNSAVRRFDLENLRTNPSLGDDLFRFTPPAGARVVERN